MKTDRLCTVVHWLVVTCVKALSHVVMYLVHWLVVTCVKALSHVVMYLVLAPFDNEQSDLVHRVNDDIVLEQLPIYRYHMRNNLI